MLHVSFGWGQPTGLGTIMGSLGRTIGWIIAAILLATAGAGSAADWPMWRHDPARSGTTPEKLPEKLHLQWTRDLGAARPAFWQVRQERVQFDLGFEPIVIGQTIFVGSSTNDRITAYDTASGRERWRFYAEGPIRLAPTAMSGRIYFGSDDGQVYCLDAATGKLVWKVRGAPSNRKILGNGRVISVWPIRGGPVAAEGRVYFAAGVWPFEGIFIHAADGRTGESIWVNDRCGAMYAEHPHAAWSFGGPSPQGYLLLHEGRLIAPSSRAFPAHFDPASGKLLGFDFGHGGHGSQPGSWFVAEDGQGQLCVDPRINSEIHDEGKQVIGQRGIRKLPDEVLQATVKVGQTSYRVVEGAARTVRIGGKEYRFDDGLAGVEGTIHTMLAGDGRLFVVNRAGRLYCFGGEAASARHHALEARPAAAPNDGWRAKSRSMVSLAGGREGYALVLGLGTGRLAEELASQTQFHIVAVDPDAGRIEQFRRKADDAGLYGGRMAAIAAAPLEAGLPPYLASLIVCEDPAASGFDSGPQWLASVFNMLRPYGGTLVLECSEARHDAIGKRLGEPAFAGASIKREGGYTVIVRGPLPGAANYTGLANYDERVRAPLGVLWFGDTLHHHKLFYQGYAHEGGRGLPPYIQVVDGVMSYVVPKEPLGLKDKAMTYLAFIQHTNSRPQEPAYTDIYTGRVLSSAPATRPSSGGQAKQPNEPPTPPTRKNPITGVEESREFLKTFGCDQIGADYGNVITMRSGTAAFYDKRAESGTINISGTRSGCRNSMVAAGGILNIPAWTGNCTCNYPVYTSMALVTMPPEFEQWAAWGPVAADAPIQRVGINFGAPGDRMAPDGTLWLDWPSVGGPSPDVRVQVTPENVETFYHHAMWSKGGQGWPWVFASGLRGVRTVKIDTTARAPAPATDRFAVRWTGRLEAAAGEEHTFHVRSDGPMRVLLNGQPIADTTQRNAKDGVREASGKAALAAGTKYDLRIEYRHLAEKPAAAALAELSWSSPSTPRAIIPPERFWTPDGKRGGLAAAYFASDKLSGAALPGRDPQVKFAWGKKLPEVLAKPPPAPAPAERSFTVRLVFAEPESMGPGQRVFAVRLQGREVLKDFDIAREAGGSLRGIVREFRGVKARESIDLEFVPATAAGPVICGVEVLGP